MQSTMYNLFPVPVQLHSNFLSIEEAEKIFFYCKEKDSKKHSSFLGEATSNHEDDANFLVEIERLCPGINFKLETIIDNYASLTGLRKQKIFNSWFNTQQKGSVLKTHLHANCILSGALYIFVDDESSKLYFNNPNNFIKYFEYNYDSLTDYNFEYFYVSPKIGDLLIFPSWLEHGSNGSTNETVDRTVISFNTTLG